MKAKKLIEVALPIKEISAESVRDKYVHTGHLSTLHIWWARRPLPLCRAAVFASLVPDPLDENCPEAFKWAVELLLNTGYNALKYQPYKDIPYTSIVDEMDDNLRNRLMMFIGKFSKQACHDMTKNGNTPQKDLISDFSLIKCEARFDKKIINIARELIWVAYNSEKKPNLSYEELHNDFEERIKAIEKAEEELSNFVDRHKGGERYELLKTRLTNAIEQFQLDMPSVFDPFAGGGAIPLEAARLGCRSYGNDINPVAHIIERCSAEFPQKYGKPIKYSKEEFLHLYGEEGLKLYCKKYNVSISDTLYVPNRLAFDVDYYSRKLLKAAEDSYGSAYGNEEKGIKPVVYYWARTAKCSNPSCGAQVPMLKQFYLANKKGKQIYLNPIIAGNTVSFELKKGKCDLKPWNHRGNIICPCCGNTIPIDEVKEQSRKGQLENRLLALVYDTNTKDYKIAPQMDYKYSMLHKDDFPKANMQRNSGGGDTFSWGIDKWQQLYTDRQIDLLTSLADEVRKIIDVKTEYDKVVVTYLSLLVDRICSYSTSFGRWIPQNEQVTSLFGRQAIAMNSDFPEINIFSKTTSGAYNQLDWIVSYIEAESESPFYSIFKNASSGEKEQFGNKELTAVITDPPYYNAIAYADNSDFFYMWLKRMIGDLYPLNFATPQTPKTEECTALKHHHNNSEQEAKKHFENKLTQIFDAIEQQTSDVVSIMFAHQSTEAWTTLCNSILDARMNITGSWAIDSERDTRMVANAGAALESSVTVACRPSERKGFADFDEVKHDIRQLVKAEVEKLYSLGFRGADLLTACFGQAVSVFGHYKLVETAEGDPVSVGQLLEFARESAAQALLEGVPGEPQTKFYCGWLQMNGMAECDFDDVNKYTRVGVNVEIRQLQSDKLLITEGSKQHLATAEEHVGSNENWGTQPTDYMISQVHRMMLAYRMGNQVQLLKLVRDLCPQSDAPQWRVLDFLGGHLPEESQDYKDVKGILASAEMLRQKCKEAVQHQEASLDFEN